MPLLIRRIRASGPGGASTVTYTDTGGPTGLTPFAAMVTGVVVSADDTATTTARVFRGFTDGTNQVCAAGVAEHNDATATAATSKFADTSKFIVVPPTTGGAVPVATGAWAAFGVNTIDVTWDAANGSDFEIVLFYGSGCWAVVGSLSGSATIGGTTAVAGMPDSPEFLFGLSAGTLAFTAGGASNGAVVSRGFAARLSSVTQCSSALVWERNAAAATSVGNISRDDALVTELISAAGVVSVGAWLEASFDANGFTATTRNAATAIGLGYLAIGGTEGLRGWAGVPTLPTSGLGAFSRTDPGFRPQALFFEMARVTAANTLLDTQGVIGGGYVVSNGQGCTTVFDRDNRATSESSSTQTATYCALLMQATSGVFCRFSQTGFTATGWDGDVATAAGVDLAVAYFAIEDRAELIDSETEQIADQHAFGVGMAQSETETISDEHALLVGLAQSETENIADEVVLVSASTDIFLVVTESVSITEDEDPYLGGVLVALDTVNLTEEGPVFTATMVLTETVELHEAQNFSGQALLVISESVELSEFTAAYLGALLVLTESETITDSVSFGRGLIPTHGTDRGTTLQGGAEAGAVLAAYSERGSTLGG